MRAVVSRRLPTIRQMEAVDCGAACLGMALAYHGRHVPLDELRELTGTDRDGVDALAIVRAARSQGLAARGVAADLEALEHLPKGSILHWEFGHFVVFDGMTGGRVRVVDPAQGRRRMPLDVVRRAYTGVAIVFEPTDDLEHGSADAKGTWRYLRPILAQTRTLSRVLATSLLIRVAALGLPVLTGLVVDQIAPSGDRGLLLVVAAVVGALIAYHLASSFLRAHLLLQLRTRLDVGLTTGFVDHLVNLPYAFFLRRSAGDLMMRLQSNSAVREILTTGALSALLDGALACLYLILLGAISAPMALLVLLLGLLEVVVLGLSWRRNQRLMSESLQAQARSQSYAYELLAGIETLKASGAEHRAAEHWTGLFIDQVNVDLARGRLGAAVEAAMGTLRVGAPLLVLLYGAVQVVGGRMSLGTMLAVAALAAGFLEPLATLVATGLQVQLLGSYMERINDVLDTPREQEGRQPRSAGSLTGDIRAEDVSFAYGPLAQPVVREVSLRIRPGQHVGIVGRSGSGKSTLAHLLLGLYRPASGRILFDGIDLAQLEARSVRRQLGIVTQRPYLFASTIRENIALADPTLPLDAVVAAAKLACIHDEIVAMPMGYDTVLMDGGSTISGGQRQRLALARALVHRPSILVLDEATSELDTVTERGLYANLASLPCTTIVIAHRLSTVADADLLLVMEDGRIVEQGTHAQLLGLGGAYRELVQAQGGPRRAPSSLSAARSKS